MKLMIRPNKIFNLIAILKPSKYGTTFLRKKCRIINLTKKNAIYRFDKTQHTNFDVLRQIACRSALMLNN